MIYAPVLIPTLCRSVHFKRCVDSLARCSGASATDLYIGVDYPTKEDHWAGYREICEYCKTLTGFNSVNVFVREENYGQKKNNADLKQRVRDAGFDRYILTEDDNEFSPDFLEYVNEGLERYKDDPEVIAICGYSHPDDLLPTPEDYPYNVYCMRAFIAWGVGNWFDKQDKFSSFSSADELVHSYRAIFKLFCRKKHQTVHRLLSRHDKAYGDLRKNAYCALENKYCIFPMKTKVRNWGFDGSGTNCAVINSYAKRSIDESAHFVMDCIEIGLNKAINKTHNAYYGGSLSFRMIGIVEYLVFRWTGKCLRDFPFIKKMMRNRVKAMNENE